MNTKSILSFGALIAVTMITMSLFGSSITSNVGAQGQANDTTQIKSYLTEAMQALDSGNNTMALEQLDLAEAAMAGTGEDDDEGEAEEGPGEDEDEPGDVDANDEEDAP